MAMSIRRMHSKWKPLFHLQSRFLRNCTPACLCYGNLSTQVTIATASSRKKTCVMKPTLRHINSGQVPTIDSTVFCDKNKARAIKFMSSIKPRYRKWLIDGVTPRAAGVCVPLCTIKGIPSLLFTLRSKQLSSHRGEISFPGGLKEDGDKDVTETALREMNEELGIAPEDVEVWSKLISIPNRAKYADATATVAYINNVDVDKLNEQRNKDEVELVFAVPISDLCDPRNNGYTRFDPQRSSKRVPHTMPVYKVSGFHIWGLTALFTDLTLRALLPKDYKSICF